MRTLLKLLSPLKLQLILIVFALFTWGTQLNAQQDLNNPRDLVSFLYYMRSNYPDLYYDFVTRLNAFEYFDNVQASMGALSYNVDAVDGHEITISLGSEGQRELVQFDENQFRSMSLQFIDEVRVAGASLRELISGEFVDLLSAVSRLEGLNNAMHLSGQVASLREFLSLSDDAKLGFVKENFAGMEAVPNFQPERIGLSESAVSGNDFIAAYEQSLVASQKLSKLTAVVTMAVAFKMLDSSSDEMRARMSSLNASDISTLIDPSSLSKTVDELVALVHESPKVNWPQKKTRKILADVRDTLNDIAQAEYGEGKRPVLLLERAHPLVAGFRGSVGDCSSTNSACVPFAQEEQVFWIRDYDTRKIKGYIQFSRVNVNSQIMLYVHTISGALVSKQDAISALSAVSSLKHLWGAAGIVLPAQEKIFHIINYPAIGELFKELIAQGREVEIGYRDADDRASLAPFLFDTLDLPETNRTGVYVDSQILERPEIITGVVEKTLVTRDLYADTPASMAAVIAFELKNREVAEEEIQSVLKELKISNETFADLWSILEGNPNARVDDFYSALSAGIQRHSLALNVNELRGLPLLFRGHFAGSDSLSAAHVNQTMTYLENYLLSYTDVSGIYDLIASRFDELVGHQRFVKLVRRLFSRLENETGMVLDQWELEHKSAYRTIIFLFERGLPTGTFSKELETLVNGLSIEIGDPIISDGNYLMRMSLVSRIFKDKRYHAQIMDFLNTKDANKESLHLDHRYLVAEYFAAYMKFATDEEVAQIGQFLARTSVGMSIAGPLGFHSIDPRLDVNRIFESLMAAGLPEIAAYLVHGGELAGRPQASQWLQAIYDHRAEIEASKLLDGLIKSPQWLRVKGSHRLIGHLIEQLEPIETERTKLIGLLYRNKEYLNDAHATWVRERISQVPEELTSGMQCQNLF